MPASTYAANALLNLFLRGVALAAPARLYVSLHTANPGNAGASEVTTAAWPAYTRIDAALGGAVAAGFAAAANKATENSQELLYPPHNGAAPITITHFAIWSAAAGGNMIFQGQLTAPKTLNPTDECIIHAGDLDITVD
ncbi:hypothetical protein A6U97_02885 [Agrobacterium tumefaciens]|uniref:Uncharacterized protein n=1 Tax=Agrobacterium tumefaciens TaxID=358 RepID=A0AAJ4N0T9_AGRTU|nr:hypothetical protein [Agrobacterium tumefaciens]NTA80735.1 hypothetical protein [Agrobacterium tumefaciens]OCJ67682.1 hypothetical protein A6U97_02885 [Agrobacterium tumefaciens]QTG13055.1 hypothetical protein G6M86_07290 [Agrobacterium tumefaciens]